jgi:hypothetical protein
LIRRNTAWWYDIRCETRVAEQCEMQEHQSVVLRSKSNNVVFYCCKRSLQRASPVFAGLLESAAATTPEPWSIVLPESSSQIAALSEHLRNPRWPFYCEDKFTLREAVGVQYLAHMAWAYGLGGALSYFVKLSCTVSNTGAFLWGSAVGSHTWRRKVWGREIVKSTLPIK